jgi:hypothetical protein
MAESSQPYMLASMLVAENLEQEDAGRQHIAQKL